MDIIIKLTFKKNLLLKYGTFNVPIPMELISLLFVLFRLLSIHEQRLYNDYLYNRNAIALVDCF